VDVLRASARHKEVAPMTDRIYGWCHRSARPNGSPGVETVAAARCPVDVSTYPRRHVIVVRHAGERQAFPVSSLACRLEKAQWCR